MKLHALLAHAAKKIWARDTSCFNNHCFKGFFQQDTSCEAWRLVNLKETSAQPQVAKDVIVLQVNYFAAAVYDSMGCLIVYSRKNYHFVTLISLSIC